MYSATNPERGKLGKAWRDSVRLGESGYGLAGQDKEHTRIETDPRVLFLGGVLSFLISQGAQKVVEFINKGGILVVERALVGQDAEALQHHDFEIEPPRLDFLAFEFPQPRMVSALFKSPSEGFNPKLRHLFEVFLV